jgi:hypothetical protein
MYGPVDVSQEMIGFTPENKVKVWLNENYSRNVPDASSQIFRERRKSNDFNANKLMMAQIFECVEAHDDEGYHAFRTQYRYINAFNEAIDLIRYHLENASRRPMRGALAVHM